MSTTTSSRKGSSRKRGGRFSPIPLLVAIIVLAMLGYFYLSLHGPILVHFW